MLEVTPKGKQALKLHQDIIKENLGKASGVVELTVVSSAQYGKVFTVSRRYGEPPIVRDAANNVSQLQPRDLLPCIEFYGQNEIYELAQDSQSRVQLLERFLPRDLESTRQREQLQKRLQDNQQKLLKVSVDLDEVKGQVAQLPKLTEQMKAFHALGIESKLAKAPLFAREEQLAQRVDQEMRRLDEGLANFFDAMPDLSFLARPPNLWVDLVGLNRSFACPENARPWRRSLAGLQGAPVRTPSNPVTVFSRRVRRSPRLAPLPA